jgi:hypothetical protein
MDGKLPRILRKKISRVSLNDGVRGERNNEKCVGFGLLVRIRLNSVSAGIQESQRTGRGEVSGSSGAEEEEKRHTLVTPLVFIVASNM